MTPAVTPAASDRFARELIRTSLDESLVVEASAGTGKTSELVRRIVAVLETGRTSIEKLAAVTFTNKAAGELKLRLRQGLDRRRAEVSAQDAVASSLGSETLPPRSVVRELPSSDRREISNLEDALAHLEEASIGTIHSFCAQILRERPVEAVVDPAFEEIAEPESARIFQRAFQNWLQQKLNEPAPGLRRALARLAWRDWDGGPPIEQLQFTARKLAEWRDFPAPWRRQPFEREAATDGLVAGVRELAALSSHCQRPNDPLRKSLRPARDFVIWIDRAEAAGPRDYDAVESLLLKLQRDLNRDFRKGRGPFANSIPREDITARYDRLQQSLREFKLRADADLAAQLRDEMWGVVERYDRRKRRSGKLDFVDLLLLVRGLIVKDRNVREYLQSRFSHIFVDEFQDTDPLQAEILLLLAADDPRESDWRKARPVAGKLFVVGDPKQSIYKFRRADVVLYQEVRDALVERGARLVRLTKSYRSVRPIQDCINAAFAPEMTGDSAAGQAAYSPLEEHTPSIPGQPAVVALPVPAPYGSARIAKASINESLPGAITGFIEWLLTESHWKVHDPSDRKCLIPVQARHVAILFRRFTNWGVDVTRAYTRSLEARGIPHLLVGSKSFHDREEVETLRAAVTAIEWPEDELSVFATLRGSLFSISDNVLLRFRVEIGRLHPFTSLPENLDAVFEPIRQALDLLKRLHRGRNQHPIADTVNELLEATRAHAGFALRPAGHQVLANVHRIADLARSFETGGGISFRGFVEDLAAQAEKSESAEAPVLDEDAEGVRLMTVHNAKGLEFPIVILADMTAKLAAGDPERHVDGAQRLCATRMLGCAPWELIDHDAEERVREQSEGVRVAYVAATRAADLLVVPAVGDAEQDGWISPLNKAIYPARNAWRESQFAFGCPKFGESSVLERPLDYAHEGEFSVKPGLHQAREGSHEVVWWDPASLKLRAPENFGLRSEEILADKGEREAAESKRQYDDWKSARAKSLEQGTHPQLDIFVATEAEDDPPAFQFAVQLASTQRKGRPAGRRFGTLIHAILRDLDFAAPKTEVTPVGNVHARILGAPDEELQAAIDAVTAALNHPLLQRAQAAPARRREWPLVLKLADGRLLEGVIDLAFQENGSWIIVDFKSDANVAARRLHYERQLRWYAYALQHLGAPPTEAWLLVL
ncbi:MAG TPA: UvrD-helicase domain-containing protein [Bryobacteraceae bacterium]|nr:UvrD-helicase domain-containing protein [Bryobacteraceae bacterium]